MDTFIVSLFIVLQFSRKILACYTIQFRLGYRGTKWLCLFGLLISNYAGDAQVPPKAQEIWPTVDVYYRFNQRSRLYVTGSGTRQQSSNYTDGTFGAFIDFFLTQPKLDQKIRRNHADSLPGKFFWIRGGYQYSATPPSSEDPFRESIIITEANTRFYLPLEMLLTFKNRLDWRVRDGEFTTRYRPRITIEKDLHTDYLFFTVYAHAEYFLNFSNNAVNRFRAQAGFEFKVTKKINYEVFWNHQFAHEPEISQLNAFGMALKIYLHKKARNKASENNT